MDLQEFTQLTLAVLEDQGTAAYAPTIIADETVQVIQGIPEGLDHREALQETLLRDDGVFVRSGSYLSPKFGGRVVRASFSNPPADVARFSAKFPAAVERLRATAPPPRAA